MTDQNLNHLCQTIEIEDAGITAINLHDAQNAIRRQYGSRYHVIDQALSDVKALWRAGPDDRINDCGVFEQKESFKYCAGRYQADFAFAGTTGGLWAMNTGFMTPVSGSGGPVSVWNRLAFTSRDDARLAAIYELINRFNIVALSDGYADQYRTDAKRMIEQLETAKTPQLDLF